MLYGCSTSNGADLSEWMRLDIADAFWDNYPYLPRPCDTVRADEEICEIFSAEYIHVRTDIAREHPREGEDVEDRGDLIHRAIFMSEDTVEGLNMEWWSMVGNQSMLLLNPCQRSTGCLSMRSYV